MERKKREHRRRDLQSERVAAAMRRVPRERFVPEESRAWAHEDRPLAIGSGQTISQPSLVARMTRLLRIQPGDRVLEIGTGSGYQAAILAELTPHVFSVEILPELAERAKETLHSLGYDHIHLRVGDGAKGWPEEAPFDAIVVTAAPGHVPPALPAQLARGGRLCIPVGPSDEVQQLLLVYRDEDGKFHQHFVESVVFVPMTTAEDPRQS